MSSLGKAQLGATTFCASVHPNDKCGANGLPLTPNSIKILGCFQVLRSIEHPHLCKYLHLIRSKQERVIVVAEHHAENLKDRLASGQPTDATQLVSLAYDILEGLSYLNHYGIVHRNLAPENILFDSAGRVKLSKYGMYHMTGYGTAVSFPIAKVKYLCPEVLSQGPLQVVEGVLTPRQPPSGPKADVWSLGLLLVETYLGLFLWPTLTLQQLIYKILGFLSTEVHPLDIIAKDQGVEDRLKELPAEVLQLIKHCLTVSPTKRLTPAELLPWSVFTVLRDQELPYRNGFNMFTTKLRCENLELPNFDDESFNKDGVIDHLSERSIDEVYYLWQLAGGDLETTLKKTGLIKNRPPITAMADFVIEDGEIFGQERDRSVMLDDTVVILSLDTLRQRLEHVDEAAYYPLLEDSQSLSADAGSSLPTSPSSTDLSDTASLPLVIREKDIEYQFHRIILYERLLKAYPYKRVQIWKEARVDIPPLVRAQVWAALLEIEGDVQGRYDAFDKETPTLTDRQIEVDIPRCHQYNELLSSPTGHMKFKRLLKSWVVSHPEYVYWQGLDSLCAPFLYLNFNDEALAFACLSAFIPKYLHNFFLKDNSPVIQEYLAVFSHLIAFHDPELSNHLDGIGFIPDLYAIPWFLTMYAHVFPLHKIFHLWDTLLLGNSSFPLCIGVAILQQLRDQLLSFGFNECILLFSDMPGIDIERCVADSIKIFCSTPKSATYRQYAKPAKGASETRNGRPNLSYYSQDYQALPKTDLSIEPVPLEDLKSEKCLRISADDLIDLCELHGPSATRSPTKKTRSSKPKMLVIDIRNQEDFVRGTVPGSINIPFNTAFSPEGDLIPTPAVQALNAHKFQIKVVIGSRGKNATNFASALVCLGYCKVCLLHKGIDVLRPTGLLVVPPPEL